MKYFLLVSQETEERRHYNRKTASQVLKRKRGKPAAAELEKAEEYYQRAVEIFEKALGKKHRTTLQALLATFALLGVTAVWGWTFVIVHEAVAVWSKKAFAGDQVVQLFSSVRMSFGVRRGTLPVGSVRAVEIMRWRKWRRSRAKGGSALQGVMRRRCRGLSGAQADCSQSVTDRR